jgi:hypothetical protein
MLPIVTPIARIFEYYKTHGVQEVNVEFVLEDVNRRDILEDLGIYCRTTL